MTGTPREDTPLEATMPGRVALLAERHPDAVAIREKLRGVWRETTWREYLERVAATAHALADLGVGAGDHVGILSDNRPEWLYADLGTQALGARAVGIYQTNPPPDVAYILDHAGCKVLICEDQEQVDKAIEVAAETPTVEHVVVIDPRGTRHYDDPRPRRWDDLLQRGEALRREQPGWFDAQLRRRDPDEPTMVVYTSGTTGRPKGALLSASNAMVTGAALSEAFGASPRDTLLSYLPLCHVAEKIFSQYIPLSSGAVVHFGESIATVQEDLREVSPTVFLGVPRIWEKVHAGVTLKMRDSSWLKRTLYTWFSRVGRRIAERRLASRRPSLPRRVLDAVVWFVGDLLVYRPLQERLGMRRCRLPVSGAAPISQDLLRWFHGIGVPISEGFGMTECAGVSHVNMPGAVKLGTVGTSIPLTECATAADGEVLLRGPFVFRGYLHDEAATRETVDDEGWLHTGDVGEIDGDGYLRITGRKKEIIITAGGKNLSPEKIENALKTSPYIKEAVAIGDGRKFVSALIQIETDSVGQWATRQQIPYTSFEDLSGKPEVRDLIAREIRTANDRMARVESVREFRLFRKELHQDDGELTATQKVRRRNIFQIYGDLIEEMYGR